MTSLIAVNLAHLHLLLNHVPTVGSVVALGLLLLALVRRNEHLKHAGLEVLFVIAVVTLPVYMSGVAAYQELRDRPEISDNAIEGPPGRGARRIHRDRVRRLRRVDRIVAVQAPRPCGTRARPCRDAAVDCGARAHGSRGDILEARFAIPRSGPMPRRGRRRACRRRSGTIPDVERSPMYMVNSPWAWPAAEAVHFLGLSLSFGVLLAVNLRILGVMRQVPFADVHRLLPWGMLGFGANLITGMLFFIGQPGQYIESAPFYWKVVFLMIAGANFLYLTVFKKAWAARRVGLQPG